MRSKDGTLNANRLLAQLFGSPRYQASGDDREMTTSNTAIPVDELPSLDSLFSDLHPALTERQAAIESARCLYCYDAPCIKACPTGINIPSFIAGIHSGNLEGAAQTILESNIMGGSCSRVCPTEILCEQSCVRNKEDECAPVLIGSLQRYATDNAKFIGHPFRRAEATGKTIAVIGAGPAGLSCAHRLAMLGHEVDVFEAEAKIGGLNEYGIAKYKLTNDFARQEAEFILGIGGIKVHTDTALGKDVQLADLTDKFDAVFLGIGLQSTRQLLLEHEDHSAVMDAVDYIKTLRQAADIDELTVPESAIVIGAGNTAIDIACQLKRLGSEDVTLVYRRGEKDMGATPHEQEIAKQHQVRIRTWSRPESIEVDGSGRLIAMNFRRTEVKDGSLTDTELSYQIPCAAVFKAVGQTLAYPQTNSATVPVIKHGKISVDEQFKTSIEKVFAGGDCTGIGQDLTVEAVQQGKLAALAIHQFLLS